MHKYTQLHHRIDTHVRTFIATHTHRHGQAKQCRRFEKRSVTAAHALPNDPLSAPLHLGVLLFIFFHTSFSSLGLSLFLSCLCLPLYLPSLTPPAFRRVAFYSKVGSNDKPMRHTDEPVIIINTRRRRCIISTTAAYLPAWLSVKRSQITRCHAMSQRKSCS